MALLNDGSPLEALVDDALVLVFWFLLVLPMVLVPLYFLGLSLMK